MEKKKNPESVALHNKTIEFIAPASFFRSKSNGSTLENIKSNTATTIPEQKTPTSETKEAIVSKVTPIIEEQKTTPPPSPKKIDLKNPIKRVSGLSISSLKAKKEHELNRKENVVDEAKLPRDAFPEEKMQKLWAAFVDVIDAKGQKILASNLNADVPKLRNQTTIWIELPNNTMKKEVEREQYELMEHLKKELNNYFIELKITVNETTETKFAFTPEEKYEKLRQKNPIVDLLRQEFDMDIN
ncbi:hypothetical protein [uncultured Maribacter sp.]|uniref:hypothetical protein n=1 Tax=uncultured Maribacter sp. TaxID=431308 RepID=UPI00341C7D5A